MAGDPGAFNPVSLGTQELIGQGHQALRPEAFDEALKYAEKAGTHLWAAILTHRISDAAMATLDTNPPIFDTGSLLFAHIGCLVCEEPYEPRMLHRRCKGDPG